MNLEIETDLPVSEWNDFLSGEQNANIFQTPLMFELFKNTEGFSPRVFVARVHEQIDALLVSVLISSFGALSTRYDTRAVIFGGPLGNPDLFPGLVAAHDDTMRTRALMSQVRNLSPPKSRRPLESSGYRWEDHLNYTIDLTRSERILFEAMSRNRRRNIAIAEKAGVSLVKLGAEEYEPAYQILKGTYRRARIPLARPALIRNAFELLLPKNNLWAFGVKRSGELCAIRLVLNRDGYLYDWYAGSTESGRVGHADEWLVWLILQEGKRQGCQVFDFGGAGRPSEDYGPGEFKRKFGGDCINPGRFTKIYHPISYRLAEAAYRAWRCIT